MAVGSTIMFGNGVTEAGPRTAHAPWGTPVSVLAKPSSAEVVALKTHACEATGWPVAASFVVEDQ